MTLFIALSGVVIFAILMLIAFNIGLRKNNEEDASENEPLIHHSGIYSIVRKSPRENIAQHKPSQEEIRKYLSGINEDIDGNTLSEEERQRIVTEWKERLEQNIKEIEDGDREGVEFYRYHSERTDPVCDLFHVHNKFVSREQIFRYPGLIPPLHLGCGCRLIRYQGDEETGVDSTKTRTFISGDMLPELPDWQRTVRIPSSDETTQ